MDLMDEIFQNMTMCSKTINLKSTNTLEGSTHPAVVFGQAVAYQPPKTHREPVPDYVLLMLHAI